MITEALVVESLLQDFNGARRSELTEQYYDQLYDKYGVDADYLDELRSRYSRAPGLWVVAIDSSVSRLKQARGNAAAILTQASDSVNVRVDSLPDR